ncbi:LacI family DNA-binding transcriptional regulator [Bacillus sp. CECT 9360]|uniref:LacI family DNA-binding transcriptional regulator n=1 Tax=Bacillus sp. CECT 9360 TaxID=2845821 RepID=UPI001E4D65A4|nr:LacI family DNA-binding transcriptional regulator [Bacillus sp. CECT 9360]CAH0343946.1 HTH-type transcriptional repressor MelR [Bacillus sp. CECT 9360]
MATIKEIADLSNVSASTVSRVLNNDETISVQTETRQRIFQAAKELGYKTIQERRTEQRDAHKEDLHIGIVLCQSVEEELNDPYFLSIRQGVEAELSNLGINTTMFRINETGTNQLIDGLNGLIVIGRLSQEGLKTVSSQIENVVYINHSPDEEKFDAVIIDFEKATEKALKHFLELGYKRIGYIGGIEKEHCKNVVVEIEDQRLTTFEKFMKKEGLYHTDYVYVGEYTMAQGYELMKKAIQQDGYPEAFFLASDPMAIGALRALQEVQLSVPNDIAIISFDDIEVAKFASTPLSTIKIHTTEMGRTGVKLLLDRMSGRKLPLTVIVPTELVIRESCRAGK